MRKLICYIIFFLGIVPLVQSQEDMMLIDPILVQLEGKLINQKDGTPVPYAHIVNLRDHSGTTAGGDGLFSIEMLNIDSLAVSAIGYKRQYIHISSDYYKNKELVVFRLEPIRYAIGEITVTEESPKLNLYGIPTGKPDSISPELRGDDFNEKPKWYNAVFSPISFMHYHLSKKEKEKRYVRDEIISQKSWKRISVYYNRDTLMKITGLNEQAVDSFMIYFNAKSPLNERSTEFDVLDAILVEFRNYKEDKKKKVELLKNAPVVEEKRKGFLRRRNKKKPDNQ